VLRIFMFLAVGMTLLSAFSLYAVSYQTRQISDANQFMERQAKQLDRDIAILRAERAYLMRPVRIEKLARKLGMRPVRGDQFVTRDEVLRQTRRR
jgi:cell division protein FtsL